MSKEYLEALRKTRLDVSRGNCEYNVNDYLDIIEKELKRLEAIDNADSSEAMKCLHTIAFNTQFIAGMNFGNELRTIESALLKAQEQEKALEIIKNKWVDLYALFIADDLEDYNIKHTIELTQEEFDLLKKRC